MPVASTRCNLVERGEFMRMIHRVAGVGLAIVVLLCGCRREPTAAPASSALAPDSAITAATTAAVDPTRLVGHWQRPDGGYVLEIRAVAADGKVDAGYFNPRPIHVSQATWTRRADQGLDLFVELRDANYPGATYKLRYRPAEDALTGLYHQPAVGQTFEVEFARQK